MSSSETTPENQSAPAPAQAEEQPAVTPVEAPQSNDLPAPPAKTARKRGSKKSTPAAPSAEPATPPEPVEVTVAEQPSAPAESPPPAKTARRRGQSKPKMEAEAPPVEQPVEPSVGLAPPALEATSAPVAIEPVAELAPPLPPKKPGRSKRTKAAPPAPVIEEPPIDAAPPTPLVEEPGVEVAPPALVIEEPPVEAAPPVSVAEEPAAEAAPPVSVAEEPAAEAAPSVPVAEEPAAEAAPPVPVAEEPAAEPAPPTPQPPRPSRRQRQKEAAAARSAQPARPAPEQPKPASKPQQPKPAVAPPPPPAARPAPALPAELADALVALNRRLIPVVEGEAPPRKIERIDQSLPTEETPLRLEMLRRMTLIRAVETRLAEEVNAGRLPVTRLGLTQGQEGVAVGACFALRPDDNLVVTHRALGYFLARGSDPSALVAEVYGKATGLCGGKAGPEGLTDARVGAQATGILGASTVLATGWGLAARLRKTDQVTLCIIGEGASNQGMFHEALNFAAVRDLPVVFVIVNDGDVEAARASGTTHLDSLAQRAVAYGIGNVTVDGTDAWAVYRSVRAAVRLARSGGGPTLVEARLTSRQEPDGKKKEAPKEPVDPLVRLYNSLVDTKLLTPAEARELAAAAQLQSDRAIERAQTAAAPSPDGLTSHVYSPEPDMLYRPAPLRVAAREISYAAAVNEALSTALQTDPSVFLIGSDMAGGGRFETVSGLQARFGVTRVVDAPVSPNAIVGSAVMAAASGLRPVVDLGPADLLALAADPIVNHAAKLRYMTAGQYRVPLVVRVASGPAQGLGPQHSQSLEAWLASIPGLLVVAPSTPYEAKGLLLAAIRSNNPVLFFEAKALYPLSGPVPADRYYVPLGVADIKRSGNDCTIVAIGAAVHEALAAADTLAEEGISVEVVDPRSLLPFDWATALGSAGRTGRLVVVEEAPLTLGWGAEIAAQAATHLHGHLRAPVQRVTAAPTPLPYSPALARLALAGADQIVAAVRRVARARGEE